VTNIQTNTHTQALEIAGTRPRIPFTGTGNTTDISEYTGGTGNVAGSHQLEEYFFYSGEGRAPYPEPSPLTLQLALTVTTNP